MIAMISVLAYFYLMAQILIRNLDDAVIADLRQRASVNATSTEEEARRALTSSVKPDRAAIIARLEALRARIGPLPGPSILDDLRADRARDNLR